MTLCLYIDPMDGQRHGVGKVVKVAYPSIR